MAQAPVFYSYLKSPLGKLLLVCNAEGLTAIRFEKEAEDFSLPHEWQNEAEPFQPVIAQLQAYFAGELHDFDLPLAPQGTLFQRSVWEALQKIPYGETISYAELARRIDKPSAVRAVGAANGSNPIPIIIPCHRVIGSNGALVGYGGGLPLKKALLALEQERLDKASPSPGGQQRLFLAK